MNTSAKCVRRALGQAKVCACDICLRTGDHTTLDVLDGDVLDVETCWRKNKSRIVHKKERSDE